MKDLLEAFAIFAKYIPDKRNPTHCDHDVLYVLCPPALVISKDFARLEELGFYQQDDDGFKSLRYGSA